MSESRQAVKNAADPEQVERAGKKEKREAFRFVDDLQNVMNMPQGRRVLSTLLRKCGVGVSEASSSGFNNSGSITAYNCGQIDVGVWLQHEARQSSIELYQLMEREERAKLLENDNG